MLSRFSFPRLSLPLPFRHSLKPFSSLSLSPIQPTSSLSSSFPLFLRPLSHSTSLSSLLSFHHWAKAQSLSVPSLSSDLLRHLSWFLQDTTSSHPSQPSTVLLRTDLDNLYTLWRERVEQRKPFQYIVGCEHWRDLVLVVQEGVLIPRPETEILVDLVQEVEGFGDGVWVDLGTGSGALSVAIGKLMDGESKGRVLGTDVSPVAVEVARFNVQRYGLEVSDGLLSFCFVYLFSKGQKRRRKKKQRGGFFANANSQAQNGSSNGFLSLSNSHPTIDMPYFEVVVGRSKVHYGTGMTPPSA